MPLLATGTTAEGETWALRTFAIDGDAHTTVDVTGSDGQRYWGTGCVDLAALWPHAVRDRPLTVTTGCDDVGPTTVLLHLRADVRAVVVRLSDGTREDLQVFDSPDHGDRRVAVLVHPRHLDVHRIDAYAADGRAFA